MNQNDNLLQDFFKQIKEKLTVSQVASNFIELNGANGNFKAVCPFHLDTNPSLSINDKKGVFKCFSCNKGGDLIRFYASFKQINYYQAAIKINEEFNLGIVINQNLTKAFKEQKKIEQVFKINHTINNFYTRFLKTEQGKEALDYLNSRGINQDSINCFKIGYAPKDNFINDYFLDNQLEEVDEFGTNDLWNWSLLNLSEQGEWNDFFKNRVIFPIFDVYDNIVGFCGRTLNDFKPKYLNSKESDVFRKQDILYNFNNVIKQEDKNLNTVIIVEGFMDVIALFNIGIKNAVATMGVALTTNHLALLAKHQIKNIILCFDNDQAGIKTTNNQIIKLIEYNFNLFVVDQSNWDSKDVDEYVQKHKNEKALIDKLINNINEPLHVSVYLMLNEIKKINNNLNSINKINLQQEWKRIISNYGELVQFDFYQKVFSQYLKIELSQNDVKLWLSIKANKNNFNSSNNYNNTLNQTSPNQISQQEIRDEYDKNKKQNIKSTNQINEAKHKFEKLFYNYLLWILKINELLINHNLKQVVFDIMIDEINNSIIFLHQRNELIFIEILEWLHELLNTNKTNKICLANSKQALLGFFSSFIANNNHTHDFLNELINTFEGDSTLNYLDVNFQKKGYEFLINKFNIAFLEFKIQYLVYELKVNNKALLDLANKQYLTNQNSDLTDYINQCKQLNLKTQEINQEKNALDLQLKQLNSNC